MYLYQVNHRCLFYIQELHREFVEKEQLHRHDLVAREKQKQMEEYVTQGLHRAERDRETQIRRVCNRIIQGGGHCGRRVVDEIEH